MDIASRIKKGFESFKGSIRRRKLGVGIFNEEREAWYDRSPLGSFLKSPKSLPHKFVSDYDEIFRQNIWLLHANAKKALAARSILDLSPEIQERLSHLERRREWNLWRGAEKLLDYFPSFKFSDSKLPSTCNPDGNVKLMCSTKKKGRFAGVARSRAIWIDAVEARKLLFKHRLRIQDYIDWGYKQNYIPIMMTLTIYHRWHDLSNLIEILTKAWNEFTSDNLKRRKIFKDMVQAWVRRLEITINDGNDETYSNKGWHPHFHAILFVPKDKLKELSDTEQEWRDAWTKAVCHQFEKVEGEVVGEGFVNALRRHGLLFSRDKDNNLRHVKDSKYLAKILGYDDSAVFGGDKEMTSDSVKDSKTPFDLLLFPELPAENIDLFCEYAVATKGLPAFRTSKGLEKQVREYFAEHPRKCDNAPRPDETIIATISEEVYQFLYHNFKLEELKAQLSKGYDAVCDWFKGTFTELGCPELCDVPLAMPARPPNSE